MGYDIVFEPKEDDPVDPVGPVDPVDPEDPVDPVGPDKPDCPDAPMGPDDPASPGKPADSEPKDGTRPAALPQTGDDLGALTVSLASTGLLLLLAGMACLVAGRRAG